MGLRARPCECEFVLSYKDAWSCWADIERVSSIRSRRNRRALLPNSNSSRHVPRKVPCQVITIVYDFPAINTRPVWKTLMTALPS